MKTFATLTLTTLLLFTLGITFVTLAVIKFMSDKPDTKPAKHIKPISGGIAFADQPETSVQIVNNTTENPLYVYVEYANFNQDVNKQPLLSPPPKQWSIIQSSNGVKLSDPMHFYPKDKPPPGISGTIYPPNAVGSATWQILTLVNRGDSAILGIPDFPKPQAWSIRPLKYVNGNPCVSSEGDCGMPILIESGKKMVGDMSAVDGVNFLLKYELTTPKGDTIIDFKSNPCKAIGLNPKGCVNPYVDGKFNQALVGTDKCLGDGGKISKDFCWLSPDCPAGTCNLTGNSKTWCDTIHDGQCANSSSTWSNDERGQGGPASCRDHNLFTTYCYSHDDATSSPYFDFSYKMKLTYTDLI